MRVLYTLKNLRGNERGSLTGTTGRPQDWSGLQRLMTKPYIDMAKVKFRSVLNS
jgi:hypothetical protein